jgi:hypothetical protein
VCCPGLARDLTTGMCLTRESSDVAKESDDGERESCGVAGWLERATREGEIENNWSEVRRESLLG